MSWGTEVAGRQAPRWHHGQVPLDEAALERVLAPDYLEGLGSLSLEELRRRRNECQELEVALSYVRRIAQGRLDIVHADLERRRGGGSSDLRELIERLPEILSDRVHSGRSGHLPVYMFPAVDDDLAAEIDQVAGVDRLGNLPELSDSEVRAMAERLEQHESLLSAQRRAVHQRIDVLQEELVGRYKKGEARPDDLLA